VQTIVREDWVVRDECGCEGMRKEIEGYLDRFYIARTSLDLGSHVRQCEGIDEQTRINQICLGSGPLSMGLGERSADSCLKDSVSVIPG
jgi:hypothetical protein